MAPVVARVLAGLATATVLAGAVLGWVGQAPASALTSLAGVLAVVVGWVVVGHDPRSPVGPALAWSAAAIALVMTNDVVAASAYGDDPLPLAALARPLWVGLWPVNLAGNGRGATPLSAR